MLLCKKSLYKSQMMRKPPLSVISFLNDKHTHPFDEIPQQNLFSLNSLFSSHLRNNDPSTTWSLFSQIHCLRTDLDAYTLTAVIGACSALSDKLHGQQVHAMLIKYCSESETIANTALVDTYFKCNCVSNSVEVFEEMKTKDVVTWNSMITGLVQHGKPKCAITVLRKMWEEKVGFSAFILCSVIKACSILKALRQGKQLHGLVVVMGRDLLVLGTALIDLYSNCGLVDEALNVFNGLNCKKDDAIYNALISGCVNNGHYKDSLAILSSMKPNLIALTSVLTTCAKHFDLLMVKQVHCLAIRFGFDSDTQLSNAILDMYAKHGEILVARLVFDRLPCRAVVTWTSMINAYGSQGRGFEAFGLFKRMEDSGVFPNSVTFLSVLSACAHSGLVEKGWDCLVSMRNRYKIDPGPEHHACFIDILGRAGLMEEIWDVFCDMEKRGITTSGPVLAALLNASRVNLDIEKGEFAAKGLIELEPDKPGNLVALSNFYATIERWDRVEDLRNMMNEKRFRKETGSSWISESYCERLR